MDPNFVALLVNGVRQNSKPRPRTEIERSCSIPLKFLLVFWRIQTSSQRHKRSKRRRFLHAQCLESTDYRSSEISVVYDQGKDRLSNIKLKRSPPFMQHSFRVLVIGATDLGPLRPMTANKTCSLQVVTCCIVLLSSKMVIIIYISWFSKLCLNGDI